MEGDPASGNGALAADEFVAIINAGISTGVRKVKFLGGEPLARGDLPAIVAGVVTPGVDTSIITSGVAAAERIDALYAAGLSRVNVSIHGWSPTAFATRGGNPASFAARSRLLDRVLAHGRACKLNYVYRTKTDEEDLSSLLDWAAGTGVLVNVLDDLNGDVGAKGVMSTLRRLRGVEARIAIEPDPYSLPTLRLHWNDGLVVEVKHTRLGQQAPWVACVACPKRSSCKEGIDAVRLTHTGVLRTCMDRPDLSLPLVPILRAGGQAAVTEAWATWVASNRAILRAPHGVAA